ncbi:MAG: DEAD/DEAH box helicase [Streptomycetales bacterium]
MCTDRLHPAILHHVVNTLGWPDLRPLQEEAIAPIQGGHDALLLAPTAGGKTEAAVFPLLSAMAGEGWHGLSVLYLCPLRALLNNLEPRLDAYAQWTGRRVGLWHGDTAGSRRSRMLADHPDLLLTTPESLESMLVSTKVRPRELFSELRAVVIDEVHAFAGDDRGWHVLAVLERLQRLAGRPLQRIGLSATVGNPGELLHWLQGSGAGVRPATVVAPGLSGPETRPAGDVTLDHVGSVDNAAKLISLLHAGEKRLVFCERRRTVEDLAVSLRGRGVQTFVSHSSLSVDERRRAEQAFAETRDCVIVSTSTLELGIDVGDLDRVVQVDSPRTVSSLLQRLGRTGRRAGLSRNALFLTTSDDAFLQAAGLLYLWSQGYVEPVVAPPAPRHIAAQQLLALCLQEGRVGENTWQQWWDGLPLHDDATAGIVRWLLETGHLERDSGMLFLGAEAERRFGRKNFLDLLSVFTANPEFLVLCGRNELGSVDPLVLTRKVRGPRVIVLAGHAWAVTHVDWARRRCYVEPSDTKAAMSWAGGGAAPLSFELCRAERDVLVGNDPDVTLSRRATTALKQLREDRETLASRTGTVVRRNGDVWWWTWAGARANATLVRALPTVVDPDGVYDNHRIRIRTDVEPNEVSAAVIAVQEIDGALPDVNDDAVRGLKFADVLPPRMAAETVARRLADPVKAAVVLGEPRRWSSQ